MFSRLLLSNTRPLEVFKIQNEYQNILVHFVTVFTRENAFISLWETCITLQLDVVNSQLKIKIHTGWYYYKIIDLFKTPQDANIVPCFSLGSVSRYSCLFNAKFFPQSTFISWHGVSQNEFWSLFPLQKVPCLSGVNDYSLHLLHLLHLIVELKLMFIDEIFHHW